MAQLLHEERLRRLLTFGKIDSEVDTPEAIQSPGPGMLETGRPQLFGLEPAKSVTLFLGCLGKHTECLCPLVIAACH